MPPVDARPPDAAPPDAALREGLWYVMDTMHVPQTADQATMVALDLDGDDQPDNALGGLLAAMSNTGELPIAAVHMQAVQSGRILELVGIDAASLDDVVSIPVLISRGTDVDGDAADNFSGAEPFTLDPLEGADGQLDGELATGRLRAGPGTAPIPLAFVGVEPPVMALHAVGVRVSALASADSLATGRLCGAMTDAEVDSVLIPGMAEGVDSLVQRDCDGAVCEPDSQGEHLATFFDENEDGSVPVDEFRNSSLIQSTIANPDLDLFDADGVFNPRVDGLKDSLSLCLGFTAVGARVYE